MASNRDFFNEKSPFRTLGLQVEKKIFWVSREFLAIHSPVFERMLYGEFAESKKEIVPLADKKADDILELLQCIVPHPKLKSIDDSNIDLILSFAEEYQIDDLRQKADAFLSNKYGECHEGSVDLLELLSLASKHRLSRFLEPCVKRCAAEFDLAKVEEISDGLRSEVIAAILYCKSACSDIACSLISNVNHCPIDSCKSPTESCPFCSKWACTNARCGCYTKPISCSARKKQLSQANCDFITKLLDRL